MFGQPQNKGFSFGTGTNTFGTTNASSPFGGGTTFGAAATGGGFGAPSAVNKPLFGTGATQQTSTSGLFGAMTGATGATAGNLFGQPATSTSTGFGLGQPASSAGAGLFSATPMNSFAFPGSTALGAGAGTGLFGGSAGLTPAPGTASSSTGLFGGTAMPATTVASGLFGGGSGGLFGSTTNAFGAGASSGFASVQQQGTNTKFEATPGTDTMMKNGANATVQTKHQCITAMKAYENKSLEELRVEDYSVNRKGPQPGVAGASTLFSSGASQQQQTPQQQTFGFPAGSTGFASGGTGLMFGQTPASTTSTLFGATSTGAQPVGSFGSTTSQSLFGQSQAPLFGGANTLNKPLFGQTATTASSNLFGSNAVAAPAFGAAAAPFGASPGATGLGLLGGSVAKQPFNLGVTTSTAGAFPSFATPASTGGMFPGMAGTQPTGSMFGQGGATSVAGSFAFPSVANTAPSTGFGSLVQPQLQNKPFGFSSTFPMLGGSTATGANLPLTMGAGGMLGFSSLTGQTQPSAVSSLVSAVDNSRDVAMQQQLQTQMLALTNSPYGDSPLFRSMSRERAEKAGMKPSTDPAALKAVISSSQLKVNSRPLSKLTPRPLTSVASLGSGKKGDLFDGLEEDSSFGNDSFVPRKSVKKLTVRDIVSGGGSRPSSLAGGSIRDDDDVSVLSPTTTVTINGAAKKKLDEISIGKEKDYETLNLGHSPRQEYTDVIEFDGVHADNTIANLNIKNKQKTSSKVDPSLVLDHSLDSSSTPEQDEESNVDVPAHPAGIKLTRSDYYTIPSSDELAKMVDDNGDCLVKDFTIGRKGYGSVFFPGTTNVAGLDLDEIVHFRRKEVTVYPDDESKPSYGSGLNKKAEVTLHCVWPIDKSTHGPIKDTERLKTIGYQDKVELATIKIGAKFIDYRPETGSWVFEVKHFSKYGLLDESDEDEADSTADYKKPRTLQQQDLNASAATQVGDKNVMKIAAVPQQQKRLALQPSETSSGNDDQSDAENVDTAAATAYRKFKVPTSKDCDEGGIYSDDAGQLELSQNIPASHRIAGGFGVRSETLQRMKASFFDGDEDDGHDPMDWKAGTGGLLKAMSMKSAAEPTGSSFMTATLLPPKGVSSSSDGSSGPSKTRSAALPPQLALPELDYPLLSSGASTAGREAAGPGGSWRPVVAEMATASVLPYRESSLCTVGPCLVDASTFMGRRCRVGWGPGNVLAHCGVPLGPYTSVHQGMDVSGLALPTSINATGKAEFSSPYRVVVEQVHAQTCNKSRIWQSSEENALKIQLAHSVISGEGALSDELPSMAPMEGVAALHAYGEQILNDFEECPADDPSVSQLRHWVLIWELCSVLWGQLPELTSAPAEPGTKLVLPYEEQYARREAFSRWLAYAASQTEAAGTHGLANQHLQGDRGPSKVFAHLSAGSVQKACQAAVACGDHRLALLLAQAGSAQAVKHLVQRQLADWRHSETDRFVSEHRLKVFALLAGRMLWPTSSRDTGKAGGSATLINVCEDLDWKRALAVHFWYACPSSAGIRLAVEAYDAASSGGSSHGCLEPEGAEADAWGGTSSEPYAAPPLPPYLEERGSFEQEAAVGMEAKDTCYHVLRLYCDRSYRIERILNPLTWTDDPLDYQLSWHLMAVLVALGYGGQLTNECRTAVHMRYADQLEAADQWHWAAFVLLHIDDVDRRTWAIRNLLSRHISLDSEACSDTHADREQFVEQQLGIPARFLHEAKATRALQLCRFDELCLHLIQSGQLSAAHDVLLQHVAPVLITREDYSSLKQLLTEVARAGDVAGWDTGGRIYLDYVSILESLERMGKRECAVGELHSMQTDVASLMRRLGNLHCPTARHRLSQTEMAKRVAVLYRALLSAQAESRRPASAGEGTSTPSAKHLAPYLSLLPLPEDYGLQELRDLVMAYTVEFAT